MKPKPQAVNKPSHHFIMHELAKPGVFTTVSDLWGFVVEMSFSCNSTKVEAAGIEPAAFT